MDEFMYDQSSFLIAAVLFVSMLLAIEVGFRFARGKDSEASDSSKAHINAIQASLLGVLALLLGFTFSLSLQRFDARSQAVVDEANAIGTTYLRSQLLDESVRDLAGDALREYVELRVHAGTIALGEREALEEARTQIAIQQERLWDIAHRAVAVDPQPVTSGLFIQAVNELIDSYGTRNAALDRHIPEVVLVLLYTTFLMTGTIVGYASGLAGHRASFVTYILVGLIVLLVFIIIDLDRPRRGLIEVDQSSLLSLGASLSASPGS